MTHVEIGLKLRELRTKAGLTLDNLSTLSGVNKSTISQIENGRCNPTVGLLERLVQECGGEVKVEAR